MNKLETETGLRGVDTAAAHDEVTPSRDARSLIENTRRAAVAAGTPAENSRWHRRLCNQYRFLSDAKFVSCRRPQLEKFEAKLTPDVLEKISRLKDPIVYGGLRDKETGQVRVFVGDGTSEVPADTLGQNYNEAEQTARDSGHSLAEPNVYRLLSHRRKKKYDQLTRTWLTRRQNTEELLAFTCNGNLEFQSYSLSHKDANTGARHVVEILV